MPWLPPFVPRLAAGAAVALAVGVALMLTEGRQDLGRAAQTSTSSVPAAGEVTVAHHGIVTDGAAGDDAGEPAPVSEHRHGIDPVSAGLLLADGIVVLAVLVLLLRRPRRSAPGRR